MKYLFALFIALIFSNCNNYKNIKEFSAETLNSKVTDTNNNSITVSDILKKHQNKAVLIDVWASWCGDCIQGLPNLKTIQKKYPNTSYVFLSLDRNKKSWKRGIEKFKVEGDHYFVESGWEGSFYKSIHGNWIPRYIFINPSGKIEVYRAVKTSDKRLLKALETYNTIK